MQYCGYRKRFPVRGLITAAAFLTAADLLLTYIGLELGYLAELNPLMHRVFTSEKLLCALPVFLLLCFTLLYHYAEKVSWAGGAIAAVVVLKAAIIIRHLAILAAARG